MTDNTQPEPLDLDATTIEILPEVVAEMLARAYRDKGIEAPTVEATRTMTEILVIYDALDDGRKQQHIKYAQQLLAEQQAATA